jgi:predicted kinase
MTATLHFFCGKPGAGKSTLAARIAREQSAILLSEDVWLMRLYGDQMTTFDDYIRVSRRLKTVVGPLTVDLLRAGQTVVLDFQANTRAVRAWFRDVIDQAGCAHVLHVMDTSDAVCMQRIARRNVARPEGSHRLSEDDFRHVASYFEAPAADERFTLSRHAA